MNTEFIQNACHLLQGKISPETGIQAGIRDEDVRPLVLLLKQYDMPAERGQRLLSIYVAIKLALSYHGGCNESVSGEMLTRKVLNGDYLYSLYIQLCLEWREIDLLSQLAPVIKQIQIRRADGKAEDDRLLECWEAFLRLESGAARQSRAG